MIIVLKGVDLERIMLDGNCAEGCGSGTNSVLR
jgi:hypothetical protein